MPSEGQRNVAAHGVAPEARHVDVQVAEHGHDVGGLAAS
jgi:hypothetical protein